MGLTGFTQEFTSPVSPAKMFKAGILDAHILAPKLMPQAISSASILEGDGGVGSIKQFSFTEVVPFSHVKERVDVIDKEKFEYKYTVIDGADLGKRLESATYHVKFEPAGNGGCVCKVTSECKTISGVNYTDEEINVSKDGVMGMFKAVEAYLLANPDAYA